MIAVWLFKSESESNDSYDRALKENGFIPTCIPTLAFRYINENAIKETIENPDRYSGMIFTSGRAVETFSNIYNKSTVSKHKEWTSKKIFVVGKATGELVSQHLSLSCLGQDTGNATELAQLILQETKPFDKPLFFPCGNLKRDELPTLLAKNDRDFRAVTCYETKKHSQLEPTLSKLVSSSLTSVIYLVFFSPSGVNFAIPLLKKSLASSNVKLKYIAIGPTTNAALVKQDIPVSAICPEPSPSGLVSVLKSC